MWKRIYLCAYFVVVVEARTNSSVSEFKGVFGLSHF